MPFGPANCISLLLLAIATAVFGRPQQIPLGGSLVSQATKNVTVELFNDLEELSRVVDIAYCVGTAGLGIQKPFLCASRCQDFKHFELVKTWNTGLLLSDSCGYIALSHPPSAPRIIVAFRGTYSVANTIIDLSTVPQEYVPYPGDADDEQHEDDARDWWKLPSPSFNAEGTKCDGCMVHAGFMAAWRHTRPQTLRTLKGLIDRYPEYRLTLVGHSLGGAVAALASLDFHAKGWNPQVTTFGEPRIGNQALMTYIDTAFSNQTRQNASDGYRKVTHADDPVPLLPLSEWGYRMHGEEIYISKPELPPDKEDLRRCDGDADPRCIAGAGVSSHSSMSRLGPGADIESFKKWWVESNGLLEVPARFRIWQLFVAHRDYFWRLGLCVPGGDPNWHRFYPSDDQPGGE
ncbi:MAG: hypothetical protein LQ338_002889 [Usnochroma carphineum]|nr:MAG: hypothetical protein LQ338_002889 [Usnochroma carphineum]